jgi:hypothetical protein
MRGNAIPTFFVCIFVMVVVCLQLLYLVLIRPTPPHPSFAVHHAKIISHGHILRSTIARYKPIKLKDLIDERKDHTNSITLIFVNVNNLQLAHNFLLECTKYNINNYAIFSLDNYTTCEKLEVDNHCYFDESYDFSSESNMLAYKINITLFLVQQGYNIFATHKDIILSDNPLLVCKIREGEREREREKGEGRGRSEGERRERRGKSEGERGREQGR